MSLKQVSVAYGMTVKELLRSRVVLLLILTIPAVFFVVTRLTTPESSVLFRLAALGEERVVIVSQRHQALVFIGLAAVGLLAAFLSFVLIQRSFVANCRLTLCGFRSSSLLLAKLLVQLTLIALLGIYITVYLRAFFAPRHPSTLFGGLVLVGFVYGCYGLLVGTLVRRELEGILLIALLVNLDVGWLQNPLFYADASNKAIIRYLPAFFPSQTAMVSAFTDYSIGRPVHGALLYGCVFMVLALLAYHLRMPHPRRIARHRAANPGRPATGAERGGG